ncbi:hypothetical protein I4I73_03255 [Pseudonocardia sp. KRD-184]|uniref:Tail assembly chaperone n=1 Tax=Pseudonocardia oceani TaxID=2792013 RepID=A0ABS6UG31_9PSEU|nr:hypothetical protein [Pseudonocardia oceani]MBW0088232.1 hypothetical protein [Pseudonocardia oceani]MBW0095014.1 hypothetical protein [Pseudonocardia oceani]MBW0121133.1 hypothetical protein [Pseudonocardia oceani]MBW0131181.1 hypothetical protein [Pseudonocardia oceani]MBW0132557.1 hypothetical protein [Pseudonocardia oceani]
MTRRERLLARQLPSATVLLASTDADGDPEELKLRALPADEFEQLMAEHPPTDQQREDGAIWNEATFRPALLSRSEVPLDGEESLSWEDWAQLMTLLPFGEVRELFDTALALNDRAPAAELGKDS